MPRPKKCRRVCAMPNVRGFKPLGVPAEECMPAIIMNIEEYEALRLMDFEGLTQEECSIQMGVARTTVTAIYLSARKKIAETLVFGKILLMDGGDFILCPRDLQNRCSKENCCQKKKGEDKEK